MAVPNHTLRVQNNNNGTVPAANHGANPPVPVNQMTVPGMFMNMFNAILGIPAMIMRGVTFALNQAYNGMALAGNVTLNTGAYVAKNFNNGMMVAGNFVYNAIRAIATGIFHVTAFAANAAYNTTIAMVHHCWTLMVQAGGLVFVFLSLVAMVIVAVYGYNHVMGP